MEMKFNLKAFVFALIIKCGFSSICQRSDHICEFWLTAQDALTMMHGKDLVYASDGMLIKYDELPTNRSTNIPVDEVLSVDGVQRIVQVFNGTIPGPPIIVYEGQTIIVHVKNDLLSHTLSVHWHGLHQRGTPWMDGVPMVTQCPVLPHQTFTYKFKADLAGTFWYHSHVAGDRNNGLYGAFIVKESPASNAAPLDDIIITVGDWHHADSSEVYMKKTTATYFGRQKYQKTYSFDGAELTPIPWMSALIQGKGRFFDPVKGEWIGAPLSSFTVAHGTAYRVRVIHTGYVYPLRVTIASHQMTIMASDAYPLKPVDCDAFIINPGERFDFILNANQSINNYLITTESIEDNVKQHYATAILHYTGAAKPGDGEPRSLQRPCTETAPCIHINCPFLNYPQFSNITCLTFNDLEGHNTLPSAPAFDNIDGEEHFLNFAYPGYTVFPGSINGRGFLGTSAPTLTQPGEAADAQDCSEVVDCGIDRVCWCHHEKKLQPGKSVQLVLTSVGSGKSATHPIHLHGYGFHVIKVGYPTYNSTSGVMISQTPDIVCEGRFCNKAAWSAGVKSDVTSSSQTPMKDTLNVPVGGYAVIRFHADNPGKWLIHCHTAIHVMDGMAMVLDVNAKGAARPPQGFPVCNSFKHNTAEDVPYIRSSAHDPNHNGGGESFKTKYKVMLIFAVLLVVFVVVLLCTLAYLINERRASHRHNEAVVKFMKIDQSSSM